MATGARLFSGMLSRQVDWHEFVKVGAKFRRVMTDLTVETTEVLDLFSDSCGIPHVRYELSIARPARAVYATGPRTMALRAFGQNFIPPETVRAVPSTAVNLFVLPKLAPERKAIEQVFAELNHMLRKAASRSVDAIARLLDGFAPKEWANDFANPRYERT